MDTIEIIKRWALNLFYRKREFTTVSAGASNAYQPAITNASGYFDPSLINGNLNIDSLFANGATIATNGGKGVYVSGKVNDGVRIVNGLVGFNVHYDGSNYIVESDGVTNGGVLLTGAGTAGDTLNTYVFPSTGTTNQTITPANLNNYRSSRVDANGFQVVQAVTETAQAADNVRFGVLSGTPRIILEDAGSTQWEIDNNGGVFRIFTPGVGRIQMDTAGVFYVVAGRIQTNAGVPWDLGAYTAVAPAATGYVSVAINGVTYKLLAAT